MVKEKIEYKTQGVGRAKTVKYATKERLARVNPDNLKVYEQYIRSNVVKNRDVAKTTYKVYRSYFNIFLCFILEKHDNFNILDEEILFDPDFSMVDIMEDYIGFLQETLGNNKKSINTKIAAVSSFYVWAVKRRKVSSHPFDGRLDRMKGAADEKIISEYFLDKKEIEAIVDELSKVGEINSKYDMMDKLMWHISFDSACRIGALHGLKISNLDLENLRFVNIREKRGKIVSIPFYPSTGKMIEEYLEQREIMKIDCDDLFYVTRGDKWQGMSKQSIYNRVRKLGHIIGIGDFRPHCIRKTRLNMVAKLDINKAKDLANHESLDTTSRFYTEKADATDTANSIMEMEIAAELKDAKGEKGKE